MMGMMWGAPGLEWMNPFFLVSYAVSALVTVLGLYLVFASLK